MKKSKLIQNALRTPDGTIIVSQHVHDYQEHEGYMVDGGLEYSRIGWPDGGQHKYEPLFLYENDDFDLKKECLVWGTRGKDGKQPLKWVRFVDCDDEHLKNILKIHVSNLYTKVINTILEERVLKFRKEKLKKILNEL